MTLALPLTSKITNGSSKTTTNRIKSSSYQDGPKEISTDGINGDIISWSLIFAPLTLAELQTLESFLGTVNCNIFFTYTAQDESIQRKWRVDRDSKTRSSVSKDRYEVGFTITQCFDLRT